MSLKPFVLCLSVLWSAGSVPASAAEPGSGVAELNKLAFFHGREYFLLRSGRARMIIQADRADLGPAFTYWLFDAQNPKQSARKENAFNFEPGTGVHASALTVRLGGFPFTALGHRTDTTWTNETGIPEVQAVWWAGGVRVTERFTALSDTGLFRRSIRLEGAHLLGPEQLLLELHLPAGAMRGGSSLIFTNTAVQLGLVVPQAAAESTSSGPQVRVDSNHAAVQIGPVTISPGESRWFETLLLVQIPAGPADALQKRVESLSASGSASELAATAQRWAALSSVRTDDKTVSGMFDKARYGLPAMVAEDGSMDAGIFEYGAQWVRDTSCTVLGSLHAGDFESTRAGLTRILTNMVNKEGVTMIGGSFDKPDLEQFDQMGELLHVLRAYRDWTGDDSLVREHRELLLALIERPLRPEFRDETGMVHNRREFWERSFTDAYELAYQTYVILGLREAAELSGALDAQDRATRWRAEADRMLEAVLRHPTRALVDDGHLIKRRKVTGEVATRPDGFKGFQPDVPLNTEEHHSILPDASMALPIALRVVDPRSDVARRTLDFLEQLWNTRWSDGGYDRYHTSSQPDQPGPWPFATTFILRAQHEAGLYERSRRSLEWLDSCQGGRAGLWFEEIPSVRSLSKTCGLVCWTSGEVALFIVRHYLGVTFDRDGQVLIKPALYPGSSPLQADLRFRKSRLRLEVNGSGPIRTAQWDGRPIEPDASGTLRLPPGFAGGTVRIQAQ
jgi:hypothetical protein